MLYTIITKAIKLKANIVANDYKENNLRMILNFGHTIAHALELITDYKLSHGDAVAFGIILEILIANKMQIFSDADLLNDIITMFNKLGIAARIKQTMYLILNINIQQGFSDDNNNLIEQLIKIMQYDKKNRQHKITMILKNNNFYKFNYCRNFYIISTLYLRQFGIRIAVTLIQLKQILIDRYIHGK